MYEITKLISKKDFTTLVKLLPTPRQKRLGRKRAGKEALINGILQVLINGVAWKKIAFGGCSYVSCFRYFQELQRRGKLKLVLRFLAKEKTDIKIGAIDTTTIASFEFSRLCGWDGNNKKMGTKVSLFTDSSGRPADVAFGKGSQEDKDILPKNIANTRRRPKKVLNLDMKYMSLSLRRELRAKGIRVNMGVRAQDYRRKRGPKFKFNEEIYKLRWHLERTNAWLKSFRSLVIRRQFHPAMFKALVYLAVIVVLIRN